MRRTGAEQTPAEESFWMIWAVLNFIKRAAIALVTCAVTALFALRAKIRCSSVGGDWDVRLLGCSADDVGLNGQSTTI